MLRRVALVTCKELPDLDEDTRHLIAPLAVRDVAAIPAVWDDPQVEWKDFDLVIVRSCRDDVFRHDAFVEWAARVPRVANPAAVLAWNAHKGYLRDLAVRNVPIVPTVWLRRKQEWTLPETGHWIIKSAVSLASLDIGRYCMDDRHERSMAVEHMRRVHARGATVMLQPYMHAIDDEGEISLVYLGGVFSHAMRRAALLTRPDAGIERRFLPRGGLQLRAHRPTTQQIATANQVLAAVPAPRHQLLYARVDLVSGPNGRPVLMELELTGPQLYLRDTPGAADRMAAAIEAHVTAKRDAPLRPRVREGAGPPEGHDGGLPWHVPVRA